MQKTSGLNPSSKEIKEAYEGLCEAWDSYFAELPVQEIVSEGYNPPLLYGKMIFGDFLADKPKPTKF